MTAYFVDQAITCWRTGIKFARLTSFMDREWWISDGDNSYLSNISLGWTPVQSNQWLQYNAVRRQSKQRTPKSKFAWMALSNASPWRAAHYSPKGNKTPRVRASRKFLTVECLSRFAFPYYSALDFRHEASTDFDVRSQNSIFSTLPTATSKPAFAIKHSQEQYSTSKKNKQRSIQTSISDAP